MIALSANGVLSVPLVLPSRSQGDRYKEEVC